MDAIKYGAWFIFGLGKGMYRHNSLPKFIDYINREIVVAPGFPQKGWGCPVSKDFIVQMVRSNADKLDQPLQTEILNLCRPLANTPFLLQASLERFLTIYRKLPIIIEFEEGEYDKEVKRLCHIVSQHTKTMFRHCFRRIHCCSAVVSTNALNEVLSSCNRVRRIYLNREVHALLNNAIPSCKAENIVRGDQRLTGKGITIAILDTGIYPHPDLANRIIGFVDFVNNRNNPYDDNGHGTHCAGDAAGNGLRSSGKYAAAAPEASLIGVKVLDRTGAGSLELIIRGVEWCIKYNERYPKRPIHIISMSLGNLPEKFTSEHEDPMVRIVEAAWDSGITVCVAAGNAGPNAGTITSPGISQKVITVGALDTNESSFTRDDDEVAFFSSRGPTLYGIAKPDLLVPGANIVSLRAPHSYLDKMQKSSRVDRDYFVLSGTSMATPICAGIAALILQQSPHLAPEKVKQQCQRSAVNIWSVQTSALAILSCSLLRFPNV